MRKSLDRIFGRESWSLKTVFYGSAKKPGTLEERWRLHHNPKENNITIAKKP
jgi:hypothetical protein